MDFKKMLNSYCKTKGMTCQGCEIAKKIGAKLGLHDGTCARLVEQNPDKVLPFLQEWYDNQPFVPEQAEWFCHIGNDGNAYIKVHNGSASAYALIIMRNCFRSYDAARAHRDEIMAKYAAIDNGRWPD